MRAIGMPYSPATGLPIESQTVSQMVDRIMAMTEGTRLLLLAPIVRGRKGEYRKELADLQKRGFQRVKIDGKMYEIDAAPALDKKLKHDIEVVVDRIVVREGLGNRVADSLETALEARRRPRHRRERRWRRAHDLLGQIRLPGLGLHHRRDRAAAVLLQQPVRRLPGLRRARHQAVLRSRAGRARRAADRCARARSRPGPIRARNITRRRWTAWRATTRSAPTRRGRICRRRCARPSCSARATTPITMRYDDGIKAYTTTRPFEGVIPNMERRWQARPTAPGSARNWAAIRTTHRARPATASRLKPEALAVKIDRRDISRGLPICRSSRPGEWFGALPTSADARSSARSPQRILKEINERLGFLHNVGLEYLTLSRASGTLVGRRKPAHPPGLADRLGPHRRALCAGRALDRAASARQRPAARDAEAAARSRQYGDRGRA